MTRIVRWALGGAFVLAAVAKAFKPAPFGVTVEFLAELVGVSPSPELIRWLSVGIIAFESILGCALVAFPRSLWIHRLCACTLVVFTVIVAVLLTRTDAPSCGCFGEIMLAKEVQFLNGIGLARNIALGVMLWAIWPARTSKRSDLELAS
jgi:hypothetical protein